MNKKASLAVILFLVLIGLALSMYAQSLPLYRPVLQSDMDGAQTNSMTNLSGVVSSNIWSTNLNGAHIKQGGTNLEAVIAAVAGSATNAANALTNDTRPVKLTNSANQFAGDGSGIANVTDAAALHSTTNTLALMFQAISSILTQWASQPTNAVGISGTFSGTHIGNGGGLTNVNDALAVHGTSFDLSSSIFSGWNYAGTVLSNNMTNYDAGSIRCMTVFKRAGLVYVFYGVNTTAGSDDVGRIAWASGPDMYHLLPGGIALSPTVGQWDSNHVQGPRILTEHGTNYLYYFGGTNAGFELSPNSIGVAYQSDTTNWTPSGWTKYGSILSPTTNTYESNGLWRPFVINNLGTYYLFYNASSSVDGLERISLATASSPLGPFTRSPANPIISYFPVGGDGTDQDPNILRMPDGNFAMAFSIGYGNSNTLTMAWSHDLTNWTIKNHLPINNFPGGFPTGSSYPSSVEMFMDGGPCIIWDDAQKAYIARIANGISADKVQIASSNLTGTNATVQYANVYKETVSNLSATSISLSSWPLTNVYAPWLWLKADAITGITSGWNLTNWNDSSVNGNNLSLSAGKSYPVYYRDAVSGQAYVQWASGTSMETANTTLGTNLTLIAAVSRPWTTAAYAPILTQNYTNTGTAGIGFLTTGGTAQDWSTKNFIAVGNGFGSGDSPRAFGAYPTLVDNTFTIVSAELTPALSRVWINGTAISTTEAVGSVATATGHIQIGASTWTDNYFDGRIYEIILLQTNATDLDRQKLEASIATRWGYNLLPNTNNYARAMGLFPVQAADITGVFTSGIGSSATVSGLSIVATGITNTLGVNACAYVSATAVTFTNFNGAGTAVLTNTSATYNDALFILQPNGFIKAASGLSGRVVPF